MKYFAIQLKRGESRETLAEKFLRRADEFKSACKSLDALDTIEIGSSKYVRFRTELADVSMVVLSFFPEYAVIIAGPGGEYICKMPTRDGAVPGTRMLSIPISNPIT